MGALIALALGLLFFGGKKALPKTTVKLGPAKIKAPVRVKLGPAKIKAPVKVKLGPAKITPVQVAIPTSTHDTTAVAVQAARPAGAPPIPNAAAARKVAQSVADHVRNNRKKYDRARVQVFQAFAGLKTDGLYGPQTAKALRAAGAKNVVS